MGVPRPRTCTLTVFIVFSKKILVDEKTHKYPRVIGIFIGISRRAIGGTLVGVHPTIPCEKKLVCFKVTVFGGKRF